MAVNLYHKTALAIMEVLGTGIWKELAENAPEMHRKAMLEVFVRPCAYSRKTAHALRESFWVLEKYGYYKDDGDDER